MYWTIPPKANDPAYIENSKLSTVIFDPSHIFVKLSVPPTKPNHLINNHQIKCKKIDFLLKKYGTLKYGESSA